MKMRLLALGCLLLVTGCATMQAPPGGVIDPRGNLTGDRTRTYMDIVEAAVGTEGADFAFSVKTASRVPDPGDFSGGRRVDFIWFIDADRNTLTGQNASGNDFNLHLYIDETGWHTAVIPVSDVAKAHGNVPTTAQCRYSVKGTTLTLFVPQHTLLDAYFDWWAVSMTGNAPGWPPYTENPATKRTSTR